MDFPVICGVKRDPVNETLRWYPNHSKQIIHHFSKCSFIGVTGPEGRRKRLKNITFRDMG